MSIAQQKFLGGHLVLVVALALACQSGTTAPGGDDTDRAGPSPAAASSPRSAATSPGATPPHLRPEIGPEDAALPAAVPARPIGSFAPTPWLKDSQRVAVLRRGGRAFVIAAGPGWLRVYSAQGELIDEAAGVGAAHVLELVDVDAGPGDKDAAGAEIAIGRGRGRDALDAPASVSIYRFDGAKLSPPESIAMPQSSRAQVVGIVREGPGSLWLSAFDSKYFAAVSRARRDGEGRWQRDDLGRVRVPMALAAGDPDGDGEPALFIARAYGDSREAPGDVIIFGNESKKLPTTRGARAVAVSGSDVLFADGWHRVYGRRARALISRARWDGTSWQTQILVRVAGRYGYDRLRLGDVDGDGRVDAVAAGNGPAVLIRSLQPVSGSVPALGEAEARDAFPGDLDGDGRDEVVIAGPAPGIWRLPAKLQP